MYINTKEKQIKAALTNKMSPLAETHSQPPHHRSQSNHQMLLVNTQHLLPTTAAHLSPKHQQFRYFTSVCGQLQHIVPLLHQTRNKKKRIIKNAKPSFESSSPFLPTFYITTYVSVYIYICVCVLPSTIFNRSMLSHVIYKTTPLPR